MKLFSFLKFSFIAFFGFFVSATFAEAKIAVVDIEYLINNSPYTSQATQMLEQEFKSRENEINEDVKLLEKMRQDFIANKDSLSDVQLKTRERRILTLERDIKRANSDFNELLNLRKNEEMFKVQQIIFESVEQVGERDDFDIIFYDNFLYFNNRVSISDIVLDLVKEKFKNEQSD